MASALTPDQQHFYHENGYIVLRGVFPAEEMRAHRRELHELADRLRARRGEDDATWSGVRDRGTSVVLCHDVQFHCAAIGRLIGDPRLTAPLQALIGPNLQLHHTKMFIKPPEKGSPFPLHQDHPHFPHARHTMTAAIIHLDDATIAKGCVRVVPGSHRLGPLPKVSEDDYSLAQDRWPIEAATPCEARAGDVLVFNYLTIHGSGVNTSDEARTTLLVQVRDPEDRPTVRRHESPGQGTMLAGIDPTCAARPTWETAGAR